MIRSPENATPLRNDLRDRSRFSPFDRWVNEACSHEMYALNLDKVTYKMRSGILRLWESKMPGERVADSETAVLPILAKLIGMAVSSGILKPGSGVFMIRGLPPYRDGAEITNVGTGKEVHASTEAIIAMFDCER